MKEYYFKTNKNLNSSLLFRLLGALSFILIFFTGNLSAATYADLTKFSLKLEEVTISDVFEEIENNSEFIIFYNDNHIDANKKVSLNVKNSSVEDILKDVLKNTNATYRIVDRQIIIVPVPEVEEEDVSAQKLQGNEIRGKITDSKAEPLAGVNVVVEGTTTGAVTDINGRYTIEVPDKNSVLVFSYVGYLTERITVGDQTEISIALVEDILTMEEIVVIGYGTLKKSDLTGAVASVKTDQLTQLSTYDVQQAIQGRAAGVMVTSNTGAPGDGVRVRIRGVSTINNSDPLYVVDGFPIAAGTGGLGPDISFINPSDIESVEILKDASATAIYGNRGANGVILITTKKGKEQKTTLDLNVYNGIQQAINTIPMLDAVGYARAKYIAYDNQAIIRERPNLALTGSGSYLDSLLTSVIANDYRGTDWQDEVMRQGSVQNYSLNVSGGSEKYTYNFSGSYYKEDGIIINSWLKRYLLRYSSQFDISQRLKGEFNISYLNRERTNYDQSLYGAGILPPALYADPISPMYKADTNYTNGIDNIYQLLLNNNTDLYRPDTKNYHGVNVSQTTNPVAAAERMKNNRTMTDQIVSNVGLDLKIIEGLAFTSKFGISATFNRPKRYIPVYDIGDKDLNTQSSLDETHQKSFSWSNSNYINFEKDINRHRLNLMAGQECQYFSDNKTRLVTYDIPDDPNLYYATASPFSTPPTVNQEASPSNRYEWESSLVSYFGRINYSFDSRYLLTATLRRDASSKIAKDYRWGSFPSVSAGWNIKNESFLKNIYQISALKLRLGWGKTGNEGSVTDVYSLYAQITPGLWIAGRNGERLEGAIQTTNPNERLQWEEVEQWNYAVDFGFLNYKLTGTIDVFTKKTSGMIVTVPPPIFTGTNASNANIGIMENKGVEISLNYRNYDHEFKYEIGGNITFLDHPQVIKLAEEDQEILTGQIKNVRNMVRTTAGEEMAHFYGFKTDGLLSQDDIENTYVVEENGDTTFTYPLGRMFYPGAIKLVDLNNDGEISSADKTNIGSANPDFMYGFNIDLMYKGFDLRMFFQGVYGNEMINTLNVWLKVPDEGNGNLNEEVLDGWTEENPNTSVPRLVQGNGIFQTYFNEYLVESASYFRLKNIQLGYTLPVNLTQRIGINKFRLYVSAENLLTITDYTGLDPEVGNFQYDNAIDARNPLAQGLDDAIYPVAKRILFGLNISF